MTAISGWARGTWSQGLGANTSDCCYGVAGTGAVGSVSVVAEANVPETGLAATGGVGSVSVVAEANTAVTGSEGTGAVGSVVVAAAADVSPQVLLAQEP